MKQADPDNKGRITFDDFTKLMKTLVDSSH